MRLRMVSLLALSCALLAGCGGGDGGAPERSSTPAGPPVLGREESPAPQEDEAAQPREATAQDLGFPGFATKNTTRVAGADPASNAAGVALAVFPSASADSRPLAVSVVDVQDWRAAISAAQLMSPPVRAPVLLSEGGKLPAVTSSALEALRPRGTSRLGGAQVVRAGRRAAPAPKGLETADATGTEAAAIAREIDRLHSRAAGRTANTVIVAPSEEPAFAMPAAGLAVKTGSPVLWASRGRLPAATAAAIRARKRPRIYVVGPSSGISERVVRRLRALGTVRRIAGREPVANAIAVARFGEGGFGWNVVDPGHGLVFASAERTADAAAAAALSGSGTYGPLLLVSEARSLPAALQSYLLDIQPGYDRDPVRGVYNHAWLMGDENAISTAVQARIDSLLEIQSVNRTQ